MMGAPTFRYLVLAGSVFAIGIAMAVVRPNAGAQLLPPNLTAHVERAKILTCPGAKGSPAFLRGRFLFDSANH